MAARMSVAERRGRLVEAAIKVMARDGVPRATTRAIVAEAGMPIGVFHYCFHSKEELVVEVMRTITERNFTEVSKALDQAATPQEMIAGALDAYWQHVKRDPMEHLITYELTHHALRRPDGASDAQGQYATYTTGMEAFLTAAAAAGGFAWSTPVPRLARYVLAVVEGVTFQWLVNRDDEAGGEVLQELQEHLRRQARPSKRAPGPSDATPG